MEQKWYQYRTKQFGIVSAILILIPFILFATSVIPYDSTVFPLLFVYILGYLIVMTAVQYYLFRRDKARLIASGKISARRGRLSLSPRPRLLLIPVALVGFLIALILPLPQSLLGWALVIIGLSYLGESIPVVLTLDMLQLGAVGVAAVMFIAVGTWGLIGQINADTNIAIIYIVIGSLLLVGCILVGRRMSRKARSESHTPQQPIPWEDSHNPGVLGVAVAVIIIAIVIVSIIFFALSGTLFASSAATLSINVNNTNILSTMNYDLYVEGRLISSNMLSGGSSMTFTYSYHWASQNPTNVTVSVISSGGSPGSPSDSKTIQVSNGGSYTIDLSLS